MTKKLNSIIAIFLVFAVLVVVVNSFRAENSPYVKYTARVGTYVVSVEAEALVVRDETVVEPSLNGVMEPTVSEGQRVSAYSRLGAVITGDINESKIKELNLLNNEIDSLTETLSEAGVLSIADDKVNSALELSLDKLRYSAAKNDTNDAVLQAEHVRILTERKMGVTTNSTAQIKLEEITKKRDAIASSLGGAHKSVYAPISGVYSDNMDGMENILTVDSLNSATPAFVNSCFEKVGTTLSEGPCKVINNYKWYILFNLPNKESESLTVGDTYTVKFKDLNETELNATVNYISPADENDQCAVVMQFDRYIDDFTSIRVTNVEICKEKYTGIYIPRNAVTVQGVQGVWVQNEITLEFRSVQEVYRSDDFILVEENAEGQGGYPNIALYDNIVLNPDE